jgi:serine/threonine protein kinase/Flp pilus assembly protein TadD
MTAIEDQARSIFFAALERTPDRWPTFLSESCGDNAELRARVEQLLHAHQAMGSIHGGGADALAATVDEPIRERPGTVIGPYKLMEQIGEGGMGLVFVAEQQQPVRRKVALKVIKPGMDSKQVVARFEAERQALALMDHPNIARVIDGGETAGGRPYFVMELVKGVPITEYCDQNQVPIRERLELFGHVCAAVQHAHQKGIIHRDLKPSNVLVTSQDGTPVVKVIDFGVAKAIGQQLTDKTIYTQFSQLVGTPLYMSPEQAGQSGLDVDTRSDIYSLGVLLYEILTGTTPFDKERLREVGYDEMRRIICEEEPPKPSTRISTLGQAAKTVSTQRKSDPKQLRRLFRGEPDWIVMKCLEKDRNRRYETASALAADVQHYLHDEPVLACPPSAWYRFRKFARRKKTALAMVACVLLAFAGIAGGIGWAVRDKGAREEGLERDRLAREEALDQGVETMLRETASLMDQGKWPEALAVMERAEKLLEVGGRAERPARLVELRKDLIMAERLEAIYQQPKQSLLSKPQGSFEEGVFSGRWQDAEFARAFEEFGISIDVLAPPELAAQIARRSIRPALVKALDGWASLRKRARGENDPGWRKLIAISRQADGNTWRNRCREALLEHDQQALEQLADTIPIRDVPPATVYLLGLTLRELGALDKAMAVLREGLHHHPEDFWLNDALGYLSRDFCRPPRYDAALRYYTAALALRPGNSQTRCNVAGLLAKTGAIVEALSEYTRAVELNPTNARHWRERGLVYRELRQYDKALADFSNAIRSEPRSAWPWCERAFVYGKLRQYHKAIADLSAAIDLDRRSAWAWRERGFNYRELHQYHKAIADFSKAVELAPTYARTRSHLAWLLATCPDPKCQDGDRAVALANEEVKTSPEDGSAWNTLGAAQYRAGNWKEAVVALQKSMALGKGGDSGDWFFLAMAHWQLGEKQDARHWYDKAVQWMDKNQPNNEELRRFRAEAEELLKVKQ